MATETMDEHALNTGRTFCWHELYVPKTQEALDFYTTALDFGTDTMEMGEGRTYHMLTRNGKGVAGVWGTTENPEMAEAPPHWAVYLTVDDVDAKVEKCTSMGATLVVPAMDVPSVGRMALIQDPFGAHIWLYKEAAQQ